MATGDTIMLTWDHWHIELSSICALACTRCPRSEVPEDTLNRQLDLEFFRNRIGSDAVKRMQKVTFCGNDGDPIYCRDLVAICQWIKSVNPEIQIVIVTNGSNRLPNWWAQLADVLDWHDQLHWSLDGWDQSSNEQYRVNCRWDSIMSGYQAFAAVNNTTYRVWATIAFRFNQDHLNHIQDQAQRLGFDCWQLTKSTKFNSHYPDTYGALDLLCPTRSDLVSTSQRFEREYTVLSSKARWEPLKNIFWQRAQLLYQSDQYPALCKVGTKGVFVNSHGELSIRTQPALAQSST
jgi:molybdenum cofactor biosynthesis enzyme MoaA